MLVGALLEVTFILLFSWLATCMLHKNLKWCDETLLELVNSLNSPFATVVLKSISYLGSSTVLIGIALTAALLLWVVKGHLWDSTLVLVALLGSYGSNEYLKYLFQRARPNIAPLVEVTGYSFPSGHAMVGLAFYGLLAYLAWNNITRRPLRYLLSLSLTLLVLVIGISRIYLGVHYPSDVLAGYIAGCCWLIACILALQTTRYSK